MFEEKDDRTILSFMKYCYCNIYFTNEPDPTYLKLIYDEKAALLFTEVDSLLCLCICRVVKQNPDEIFMEHNLVTIMFESIL